MYEPHLTRGQIAAGVAFHVFGLIGVVLIAAGVLSPWWLL